MIGDAGKAADFDRRIALGQRIDRIVFDLAGAIEPGADDRPEVELDRAVAAADEIDVEEGSAGVEIEAVIPAAEPDDRDELIIVRPLIIGDDAGAGADAERVALVVGIRQLPRSRLCQRRRRGDQCGDCK